MGGDIIQSQSHCTAAKSLASDHDIVGDGSVDFETTMFEHANHAIVLGSHLGDDGLNSPVVANFEAVVGQ